MQHLQCDVAIIGAGTAGIAAERSARAAGARTFLIDERFAGTTCATVGCMPSKLLIAAAAAAHAVEQAHLFGVRAGRPTIDDAAVMRRVQSERDHFAASTRESLAKLPEGVCIRARGHFRDAATLVLDDGREIKARAIVIATGSKSSVPKAFDTVKASVLTNESIFEMPTLPQSLAVVGAGPLGLELAQAFQRLGVEVRVFDETPHFSGIADEAIEHEYRRLLEQTLPMSLATKLEASPAEDGVMISWSGATSGTQDFERALIAAGRPPQLSALNLKVTGIDLNEHGVPLYEPDTLQCGESSIFIAGDADHDRPVLHEAAADGAIAGKNAAGFPNVSRTQRYVPLSIVFTDPQFAAVGAVPKPGTAGTLCGRASYADQGRAKIYARNTGLVHLYADSQDGRLTGGTLCGPAVEHTAHLIAWAVQRRLTASEVLQLPLYHPTYEEGIKPALRSICEAAHLPISDMVAPGE